MKATSGSRRRATLVLAMFAAAALSLVAFPARPAGAQTSSSTTSTTAASSTTSSTSASSTTSTSTSTTSSTSTSSSSTSTTAKATTTTTTQSCTNDYTAGKVSPGQTVLGTLNLANGCKFTGANTIKVTLNGTSIQKSPDANGGVSVTVKINSLTSGELGDPTPVSLHQGVNTVVVTGPAQTSSGSSVSSATITASFDVEPATTPATSAVVTPVTTSSGSGSSGLALTGANLLALIAFALVTIALGAHALATRWTLAAAGVVPGSKFESIMLTAASYIWGPPPGRHAKKRGPRGVMPTVRDWMSRGS